jgi:hypothetical protein
MNTIEIICTVIGAVGVILTGVWFIVQKAQKMAVNDYRLDNMENDVSGLKADVSNLKTDVAVLKTDVSLLKNDMSEVKTDISAIKTVLIKKFPNAAEVFSMKKSPRRLNELGEKVFSQINGEKFLQDNKEFFFSKIEERNPKTALDVEDAANIACSAFTDNDMFNDIKDFVYNAPSLTIPGENGENRRYDLTLGDVCYILSLPLRDMYLEEKFKK